MSINARGSRKLVIGDEEYVWRIRRTPTNEQECFEGPMLLAIQRIVPFSRAVLVVDLVVTRPDAAIQPHQTAVTPTLVREMVARAREDGWRPESGRGHRLEFPLIRDRA